jgi:SAM-dependent methyltransferase
MDWGEGRYEHVAPQLLPAAERVVERLAPQPGEHVVDVGCGTGNAALVAARRGARVTGVDPAARLLELAEAAARAEGLDAEFLQGEAASLPIRDGAADAVLSVFGVIFAPDAERSAAELARVTALDGRIGLSAWLPDEGIGKVARLRRAEVARATGTKGGPPPFPWEDREAVTGLLGPYGFEVDVGEESLAFAAGSAEEWAANDSRHHPVWAAARAALEPRELAALEQRALEILSDANEDPGGFRVTSRYAVVIARRAA